MINLSSNPIYNRMTQGSRRQSPLNYWLIGAGIAIAGGVLWAWEIAAGPIFPIGGLEPLLFLVLTFLLPVLLLCIGMIVTAQSTARHVTNEDFALIRISGIPDADIVHGYVEAALYRFQLWKSVGLGVLASSLIYILGSASWIEPDLETLLNTLLAVIAVGVTLVSYITIWRVFMTAGVWAALQNQRSAALVAGSLIIVFVIFVCLTIPCLAVFFLAMLNAFVVRLVLVGMYTGFMLILPQEVSTAFTDTCVLLVIRMA